MPAPVASGWSGRRAGLAPAGKAPPCHGARGNPSFAGTRPGDEVAPKAAVSVLAIVRASSTRTRSSGSREYGGSSLLRQPGEAQAGDHEFEHFRRQIVKVFAQAGDGLLGVD